MKKILIAATILGSAFVLPGCQDDATVASYNLSKAADNFEVTRRVVFMNGIKEQIQGNEFDNFVEKYKNDI